MSILISKATGNWTAAGTWALVDSTSLLNVEGARGGSTPATVENVSSTSFATKSSAFTPGAITIDGIMVRQVNRATSPSGTFSIRLEDGSNVAVTGTTVTVNASDFPFYTNNSPNPFLGPLGWFFLKFAAPVTLVGATAYHVACSTSVANQIQLWRDGTAGNIARMLRTTTTQAPVAGDDVVITGEKTGAGTGNNFIVTMDSTTNTDYGNGGTSVATPAISISNGGSLVYGVAASTNYYLKVSGWLVVYSGGTFKQGEPGAEIPRTGTAILEFDCVADGDFGFFAPHGGTGQVVRTAGLSRTAGKNVVQTLLNADAAANATTVTVVDDTGWLSGDAIAVASTVRFSTAEQSEVGTLNGNAGASSLTVNGFAGTAGGLAFAHAGSHYTYTAADGQTYPYSMQAEVILLTRNVIMRASGTTADSFVNIGTAVDCAFSWTNFTHMGGTASTSGTRGLEISTTTGSFSMSFCAIQDTRNASFTYGSELFISANVWNNITISDLVVWNISTQNNRNFMHNAFGNTSAAALGTLVFSLNRITLIRGGGAAGTSVGWGLNIPGATIGEMRASSIGSGSGACLGLGSTDSSTNNDMIPPNGTIGPFYVHSTRVNSGIGWGSEIRCTISEIQSWRNSGGSWWEGAGEVTINSLKLWGNGGFGTGGGLGTVEVKGGFVAGDTVYADCVIGNYWNTSFFTYLFSNFDFYPDDTAQGGILRPVTASAAFVSSSAPGNRGRPRVVARNCLDGASQTFSTSNNSWDRFTENAYISMERVNRTAGNHKTIVRGGTITTDTTIFHTASPSSRMTPRTSSAGYAPAGKLTSGAILGRGIKIPMANGTGKTVTVWVRKSIAGDGAAYNGAQPRLIMRHNAAIGQNSDTVLATAAAAAGTWEQLTGSLPAPTDDGAYELYVDCDGSAGWVTIDDWAAA